MKKIFLTVTFAIGLFGAAVEIRDYTGAAQPAMAPAPDMPPPPCWPDCDVSR